jgi:hypothetical protein
LAGRIVLSIGCDMRSDAEVFADRTEEDLAEVKAGLDELHKRKIDLADEVLVLNVGGYIGDSTRSEIDYAISHGKVIRWLEPGMPDSPEDLAERMRQLEDKPLVACKAPNPYGPNEFCRLPLHDSIVDCVYVPVDQLPASADDEGESTERCGAVSPFGGGPCIKPDGHLQAGDPVHDDGDATDVTDAKGRYCQACDGHFGALHACFEYEEPDLDRASAKLLAADPAQVRIDERAQGGIASTADGTLTVTGFGRGLYRPVTD